jgi:hypothetical protein
LLAAREFEAGDDRQPCDGDPQEVKTFEVRPPAHKHCLSIEEC